MSRSKAFGVFHLFQWSGIDFYVKSYKAVCCFKWGIRLCKILLVSDKHSVNSEIL